MSEDRADAADIVIRSDALEVAISPSGAELRRIVDAAGRDLLWDGDPAFWTGRAPNLFPVVGRVRDDHLRIGDALYPMPKHGFARRSTFIVAAQDASSVCFRLEASDATRAAYPFAFTLDIVHRLHGATLETVATVTNPGDVSLPAAFGFHPALRWPLPYGGRREDDVLIFDRDEPEGVLSVTPDGYIGRDPNPSPVEGRTLPLSDGLFAHDALVWQGPASRGAWYGAPDTPGVRLDWPDMPDLGVWTKPGAGYLCIEPWHGMADREDFTGDFRDKPGIALIPPGDQQRFTMRMTFGAGQ